MTSDVTTTSMPTRTIYVDIDSCYYNAVRKIYHVHPWTIITNRFNHVISVPHWLNGHFGVKKMTYLAPATRAKLEVNCLVEIFNVDKRLSNESTVRDVVVKFVESQLEKVKALAPEARLVHKDSMVAEVELHKVKLIKRAVGLPCIIGVGLSVEEAKDDCKLKKLKKKSSFTNYVLFLFWTVPTTAHYLISKLKGGRK